MTFKKFADKFNLSENDMIEVLKVMEYIKPDYSDWSDFLYSKIPFLNILHLLIGNTYFSTFI